MLRSRTGGSAPDAPEVDEEELVGPSDAMRESRNDRLVTDSDATVLIIARPARARTGGARHPRMAAAPLARSLRSTAPRSRRAVESELSARAGAFTGAVGERSVRFAMRPRGHCFSTKSGTWILPCSEDPACPSGAHRYAVGGRPVRVDVRVLAATHRDLEAAARTVLSRDSSIVNVVPIHLAPLRGGSPISSAGRAFLFRATEPPKRLARTLLPTSWPMRGPTFAAQECDGACRNPLPWQYYHCA